MSEERQPNVPAWRAPLLRTTATFLILILVIVVVVASRHHSSASRGARTPQTAATLFVGAANSGSGNGTAAMSCTGFAAQARSLARSGADPGISFTLGPVTTQGSTGTASLDEAINVAGSTQHQTYLLTLQQVDGLWLVCGEN